MEALEILFGKHDTHDHAHEKCGAFLLASVIPKRRNDLFGCVDSFLIVASEDDGDFVGECECSRFV